jgi:hypothetical protein
MTARIRPSRFCRSQSEINRSRCPKALLKGCCRRIGIPDTSTVIYWDSSAVLSALFKDANSRRAKAVAKRDALHLLTTLAYAGVNAVISRMQREDLLHVSPLSTLPLLYHRPFQAFHQRFTAAEWPTTKS